MVKSIILAAGKGTRMKSEIPKVLHTIFDKPILGYILDAVKNSGMVDYAYVITGHKSEMVDEYVKENYGYAETILQNPQLGTGHAVSMAVGRLQGYEDEVVIINGDTPLIKPETIKSLVISHRENKSDITVASTILDDASNYGRIVRASDGAVEEIVEEKDASAEQKKIREINTGIFCINWDKVSRAFSELKNNNAQGEYYLTDIVKWGKEKGLKAGAYIIEDSNEVLGINSCKQLAELTKILHDEIIDKHLNNGVNIVSPETTWISPDTEIGRDTIIYPNCYINGKNKIASNCKIGPFAHIRGDVEVDEFVKIGNFVELKKAKVKSHTNICHLSYVGDSEVGANVNIGAGTITANYNPLTKVKSKTIIEDNVKIGSNSVLVAPVRIKEGANVGAVGVITKDVEPWSLAVTRAPLKVLDGWVKRVLNK